MSVFNKVRRVSKWLNNKGIKHEVMMKTKTNGKAEVVIVSGKNGSTLKEIYKDWKARLR